MHTQVQQSLYFMTTHGTKNMWSYIAGGLEIKVIRHTKEHVRIKSSGLIIKGGLKIKGRKIEGPLYSLGLLFAKRKVQQCNFVCGRHHAV